MRTKPLMAPACLALRYLRTTCPPRRAPPPPTCSAAHPSVVVSRDGSGFVTPPSCMLANASYCPPACRSDVATLDSACHVEDVVNWIGNGLPAIPSSMSALGAPAGTNVTSSQAWQLFLNGSGVVPTNMQARIS